MLLVDVTAAEHSTGIRVVIDGFLHAAADAPWRRDLLVAAGPTTEVPPALRTIRVGVARSKPGRIAYQRALLPAHLSLIKRGGADIDRVLIMDSYVPLIRPQRGVRYACFVHDVLWLTHPEFWSRPQRLVRWAAFASIRRARPTLLTSSEHNVRGIERSLGLSARALHFGCGQLTDAEADAALTRQPAERDAHLLYVGAIEPRKDLVTLVDAFARAAPRLAVDTRLLLVGAHDRYYGDRIRGRIAASGLAGRVQLLGRRSPDETLDLLRTARALVFPSRAEGFGLPILEALALGTPVVASDLPEFRDWAGDTATYATPADPDALAESIVAVARGLHPPPDGGKALAATYRWRDFANDLVGTV